MESANDEKVHVASLGPTNVSAAGYPTRCRAILRGMWHGAISGALVVGGAALAFLVLLWALEAIQAIGATDPAWRDYYIRGLLEGLRTDPIFFIIMVAFGVILGALVMGLAGAIRWRPQQGLGGFEDATPSPPDSGSGVEDNP